MADLSYVWLADLEGWSAYGSAFTDHTHITHTPHPAQTVTWKATDGSPAAGCMEMTCPAIPAAPNYKAIAHVTVAGGGYTIPPTGINLTFYAKSNDANTPWVSAYLKFAGIAQWWNTGAVNHTGAGAGWTLSTPAFFGPVWAGITVEEMIFVASDDSIWYPKQAVDVSVDSALLEEIGGGGVTVIYLPGTGVSSGKNMDIDADGTYLYIGALDAGGTPVCIQLASTLTEMGTLVYDPGAGNWIEVACGRQNADRVWVSGNFGIPKLRLSEDGGGTWATIDDAWAGVSYVRPVWPWVRTEEGINVMTHDQQDVYQTVNDGVSWTALQTALPFTVGAFDILPRIPSRSIIGTFTPGAVRVETSVNNFATFYDLTVGTPNYRVTKVIVG